ncbi:hypothetical protein ECANGB1_2671 [Enterospora canceri]|uniref:Secreted protein n=1 Tax=Enterospora canceri TaxID=1081671 RepID=A0A1Y1S4V8_9MICR|nr:hypothetical protein ECANGB1_2671 [Enterospora canceri]
MVLFIKLASFLSRILMTFSSSSWFICSNSFWCCPSSGFSSSTICVCFLNSTDATVVVSATEMTDSVTGGLVSVTSLSTFNFIG